MKKLAIIALSAFLTAAALPVYADTAQEKETCAIAADNCLNKAVLLQERISKLKAEINKGDARHSPEEMKKLEQKLQDAMDQLDRMEGKK